MKIVITFALLVAGLPAFSQQLRFETSNGTESATYDELISAFKSFTSDPRFRIREMGMTDAGLPLHLLTIDNQSDHEPTSWHSKKNAVILVNNGIHPGEPDGMDASLMLARDIRSGKVKIPNGVSIALIPVYNVGGMLNRNSTTRVSQNGPKEYGFRGNSRNYDLNRDFTKNDSREARTFAGIFHYVQPHVLVDNHVSDGADFQHTMTLITTQYDKLGGKPGEFLKNTFEPEIYAAMKRRNWDVIPYVDFGNNELHKGIRMFMDPPRYSSGYAALFNTIGFMPETHMLKPYKERVKATYDQMLSFLEVCGKLRQEIVSTKEAADREMIERKEFPLSWKPDSSQTGSFTFKGYEKDTVTSDATGLPRMRYNKSRPFTTTIPYYNHFIPASSVSAPLAYVIPQGWHNVIDILRLNKVRMKAFEKDTVIRVRSYRIESLKSFTMAYEGHHKNYSVRTRDTVEQMRFRKGDILIEMNQPANRYLVEMLEPGGDDSFFSWNFFDGIMQQKEGYTDYRWEELAAEVLKKDPALRKALEEKKAADREFAGNSSAILDFIYRNSAFYEPSHRKYPVYRIEDQ